MQLLAALDVHPRVAMAILRHSRIALTMEVYTQAAMPRKRIAQRKAVDVLFNRNSTAQAGRR